MNSSVYKISLDIHKAESQAVLDMKKRDADSRQIQISLTENGKPYYLTPDCSAIFTAKKPDGKAIYNDCTIKDNLIIYDVTDQTTAVVGRVDSEIRLQNDEGKLLTCPRFVINVNETVCNDDDIISTNEATALQKLVEQVNEFLNTDFLTEETDPTIPAWAKQANPPSYTAEDVGALPADTFIPTRVSQLSNDSKYQSESEVDSKDAAVIAKIPTKVSQIDNDSNFITEDEVDEKGNGLLSGIPNKAEMDGSALKFKRDDTELFEVELPAGGGEGGLASIPVADSDTLGGVKIPNDSEIKVDSSGNIRMNYGNLNGYSISAVLATSLLYDEGAGIKTNISATLEDANSFVQNFIYELLLENISALALTVFEPGDLIYPDENYEEKIIKVSPNSVCVFKLVDGVMFAKRYEGNELRKLIVEGI